MPTALDIVSSFKWWALISLNVFFSLSFLLPNPFPKNCHHWLYRQQTQLRRKFFVRDVDPVCFFSIIFSFPNFFSNLLPILGLHFKKFSRKSKLYKALANKFEMYLKCARFEKKVWFPRATKHKSKQRGHNKTFQALNSDCFWNEFVRLNLLLSKLINRLTDWTVDWLQSIRFALPIFYAKLKLSTKCWQALCWQLTATTVFFQRSVFWRQKFFLCLAVWIHFLLPPPPPHPPSHGDPFRVFNCSPFSVICCAVQTNFSILSFLVQIIFLLTI